VFAARGQAEESSVPERRRTTKKMASEKPLILERLSGSLVIMKNANAVELGRLGGLVGGPARARALSADRRSEIARNAVLARWSRDRPARIRKAQKISEETGADVGILEHALRLEGLDPVARLAQGLRLGRFNLQLRAARP